MPEDDTERCSLHPFCEEIADLVVSTPDGSDYPVCQDCYDKPCGSCRSDIEDDDNVAKGLCQDCRDEIRMLSGDDERGIKKDPGTDQTRLITDGGTEPVKISADGVIDAIEIEIHVEGDDEQLAGLIHSDLVSRADELNQIVELGRHPDATEPKPRIDWAGWLRGEYDG